MLKIKEFTLISIIFISLTLLIFSCYKNNLSETDPYSKIDLIKISKSYLESERLKSRNLIIDSLQTLIDWHNSINVKYPDNEEILICPINGKATDLYIILVFFDKKIEVANLYSIANKTKDQDNKEILKLYYKGSSNVHFTGSISVSTIFSKFKYEWGFKNSERLYKKIIGNKPNLNSNVLTNSTCRNWYLVTYWSDGSTSYDYLYTTCTKDCEITRILNLNNGDYTVNSACGGNSSGGSSVSDNSNFSDGLTLKKLSGIYSFINNGVAGYTAEIEQLSISYQSDDMSRFVILHLGHVCLTIPNFDAELQQTISITQATDVFNHAWNASVAAIKEGIEKGTVQPFENLILEELKKKLPYYLPKKAAFQNSPCSNAGGNIPLSKAKYCSI